MKYLIDTNELIHCMKKLKNMERLLKHKDEIAYSVMSEYELLIGLYKSTNPETASRKKSGLKLLLSALKCINFTDKESKASAMVRANLESKGQKIGAIDNLIAGTAIAHNLILITENTKEFQRIDNLKIESWNLRD